MLEGELDTHLDYHKHDNVKKIMLVMATPLFPIMTIASFLGVTEKKNTEPECKSCGFFIPYSEETFY